MARLNDVQERFVDGWMVPLVVVVVVEAKVWRDLHVGLLSIDARVKINDNIDGTGMMHSC